MEVILTSFRDAKLVLDAMNERVKDLKFASILDLYEISGLLSEAVAADALRGWKNLDGVVTKNRSENVWVLTFPPAESIS